MKYGYMLMGMSPRHYGEVAKAAEAAGFESVWLPEHLIYPAKLPALYPYSDSGLPITPSDTPLYDPWIVLASIAGQTSKIRLGTNVFILPLRHPVMTARQLVTLDRMSGGRAILGAGVGWLKDEYDIVGVPFEKRGKIADEIIPLLRRLWSETTISHQGTFFQLPEVCFEPKPVQKVAGVKSIPIELGGASNAALRRAGELGDGWIEIGGDHLDDIAPRIETIHAHREKAGRLDRPFEITLSAALVPDSAAMTRAKAMGVTRLLTMPPFPEGRFGIELEDALAFIERMGQEAIGRD